MSKIWSFAPQKAEAAVSVGFGLRHGVGRAKMTADHSRIFTFSVDVGCLDVDRYIFGSIPSLLVCGRTWPYATIGV